MKRMVALAALAVPLLWMPTAHADSLASFAAAARATGVEVTQDGANASFHPQGELSEDLSFATLGSGAHARSTFLWPGDAGGNAGSLVALLGGPDVSALNDPVRAEVDSGGAQEATVGAPSGTSMTASVKPESDGDRESRAATTTANGSGVVGAASTTTKVLLHDGTLTASAQSAATGIDIGGTVHIESVLSTASSKTSGGAPVNDGSTVVHNMTIGGQQAYVDANGVHMGAPGKPSDPLAVQQANTALAASGVQIYFTAAHDIVVGQVSYYYAGSILFYWAPPGDTGKDSFTFSFGGAAVAMSITSGASDAAAVDAGAVDDGSSDLAAIPTDTATPVLDLPAPVGAAASVVTPAPARPAAAPTANLDAEPVAASTPNGLGGWPIAALLAALVGGVLLARLPALLASAATAGCPREQRPEGADE